MKNSEETVNAVRRLERIWLWELKKKEVTKDAQVSGVGDLSTAGDRQG